MSAKPRPGCLHAQRFRNEGFLPTAAHPLGRSRSANICRPGSSAWQEEPIHNAAGDVPVEGTAAMEPYTACDTLTEGGSGERHMQASDGPAEDSAVTEPLTRGSTRARNVLDREAVLAETARDPEFLLRLVKLYQQDSRKTLNTIRNGLATSDPQAVERAAHRIKGGLSFLRAHDAHSAALRLEDIGRQGSLDEAPEALSALERELVRLDKELTSFVAELSKGLPSSRTRP